MPLDIPDDLQKAAAAKSINDQVNYYIQVMDTKASYFLAGNVAAGSFLLQSLPAEGLARAAYFAAIAFFCGSILLAGGVIFPRRVKAGNSIIFWGDIAAKDSLSSYIEHFHNTLDSGHLDEQYCAQNYFAARVMRRKFKWLRWAVGLFFTGLFCALFAYWQAPHG
jgi:glucan phosphoethanolaminetransferase (alkaline phosphatase superfamily)